MRAIRVLLVEDNPADADLVRESLDERDFRVDLTVAGSGTEALRLLKRDGGQGATPPDLILLDLNLPGLDGRQVLARIRADEQFRRCPVVVLTSSEAEHDVTQSYELGANCYVVKPLEFTEYMSVMNVVETFWLTVAKL